MRREVSVILWKELLDTIRDKRALTLMIIIPLVGLPLMSLLAIGLSASQVTSIYVEVNDSNVNSTLIANWFAQTLESESQSQGLRVNVTVSRLPPSKVYDIEVVLPEGFYRNLTSIDGVATVIVKVMIGSYAAEEVYNIISGVLQQLSSQVVNERVESLARMAHVNISASDFLNPVAISTGYVLPTGEPASSQEVQLSLSVRLLEFSLFFVVNPAIVLITDAFLGEKERKTLEVLMTSPISKASLLLGKLLSSAIIGLAIALADSGGVIIYFLMLSSTMSIKLTPELLALNVVDSALLVFMTSSIITPIVLRSPSTRAAQASSYAVMMVALGIYFSALFVNLGSLPPILRYGLMLVPFTEAALAMTNYALAQYYQVMIDLAIMAAYSAMFIYLSMKTFNVERLVTSR